MPIVSSFYGIKIYIYWNDVSHRHIPHFHAKYGEYEATFDFQGHIIEGTLPRTARRLVKSWTLENKEELRYAWEKAINCEPLPKIKGLI